MSKKKIIITESQYKKIFLSEKYTNILLEQVGILDDVIDLIEKELMASSRASDDLLLKLGKTSRGYDDVADAINTIKNFKKIDKVYAKLFLDLGVREISEVIFKNVLKTDDELYNLMGMYKKYSDQVSSGVSGSQSKLDGVKNALNSKGVNDENIESALDVYKSATAALKEESRVLTQKLMSTPPNKWSGEDLLKLEDWGKRQMISPQEYAKVMSKQVNGFDELWELIVDWKKNYKDGVNNKSGITFSKYLENQKVYLGKWGSRNKFPVKSWDWFAEPVRNLSSGQIWKGIKQLVGRNIILFGIPAVGGILVLLGTVGWNVGKLSKELANMIGYKLNVKDDILEYLKDDSSKVVLPDESTEVSIYADDKSKNDYLKNIDGYSIDYNKDTKFLTFKNENGITLKGIKYTTFMWSPDNENLTAVKPTEEIKTTSTFENSLDGFKLWFITPESEGGFGQSLKSNDIPSGVKDNFTIKYSDGDISDFKFENGTFK